MLTPNFLWRESSAVAMLSVQFFDKEHFHGNDHPRGGCRLRQHQVGTGVVGSEIRCASFPSVAYASAGDTPHWPASERRRTVCIPVGQLFYEVGPDVGLAADTFRAKQLHDDCTESPEYLALLRGALRMMKLSHIDLLIVGLPVSLIALKKTALERAMIGKHPIGGGRMNLTVAAEPRPIRLLFELARADNPRLYDELVRFQQVSKRVNRLRLLAHDGLLVQQGALALPAERSKAGDLESDEIPKAAALSNALFGSALAE